ncbi:hypothetical protein KP509_1Z124600 [Ceratopteris richardii]|nr:hypothetical protein KP509_1Z124600 [Ceratopteris richardii]KAH6557269.1 hypothetical protein KP509_1Z124600 [Ceratopteris richardii]KAH6557270.1 hypothetical protein KP509_1Z124600 [Ceratopteris richardii]KAH6557271.1 hypothetical protein KP509_1Z124600 [Ceratopteris richardii]
MRLEGIRQRLPHPKQTGNRRLTYKSHFQSGSRGFSDGKCLFGSGESRVKGHRLSVVLPFVHCLGIFSVSSASASVGEAAVGASYQLRSYSTLTVPCQAQTSFPTRMWLLIIFAYIIYGSRALFFFFFFLRVQ